MQSFGAFDERSRPSVCAGETFALVLPETPTTGYRWRITELSAPVSVIEDEFTPPDSVRPGAGGVRRWLFRAEHVGTGVVHADLARARDPSPVQSFDLTIEVCPA